MYRKLENTKLENKAVRLIVQLMTASLKRDTLTTTTPKQTVIAKSTAARCAK